MKTKKLLTDMATELYKDAPCTVKKFPGGITRYVITNKNAKYCNIETKKHSERIYEILGDALKDFINSGVCLVIGLGNNRFVADSLGPKVCELVQTNEKLITFTPSVSGVTGIKSTTAIKAIASATNPGQIIVIDTLCCNARERLGTSYQISDAGIRPGSGITQDNDRLDKNFLGCPVIAIGVPLVIHVPELHYVVPKHIDAVAARCAGVISSAVMHALTGRDSSSPCGSSRL